MFDHRFVHSIAVDLLRQPDVTGRAVGADELFQVQMVQSLLDGNYEGDVTIGELRDKGSFGIGTIQGLDGELVVVDGDFWNIDIEGASRLATDDQHVPFAVLTDLQVDVTIDLPSRMTKEQVQERIHEVLDDPGGIYAVRFDGRFEHVQFRSVRHQEPPYRPFAEVLETDQQIFERSGLDAVMVGFHFPDRAEGVNFPGWHFHMVDASRSTGGHVYDFVLEHATVGVGRMRRVHLELPERGLADVLALDEAERRAQVSLMREGPATPAEMASRLGTDPAEATESLDRLVERGFADLEEGTTRYRPHLGRSRTARLPAALDDL